MNVKLVMAKGQAQGHTIQLSEERTVVGRTRGCKVRIPSADVSRKHCVLTFEDGYLYAEDLGSTNGTFINGERTEGKQVVQPGDLLEIGPVTFAVHYETPEGAVEVVAEVDEVETGEALAGEKTTKVERLKRRRDEEPEAPMPLDDVEVIEEIEAVEDVEVVENLEEVVDIGFNVDDESLHLPKGGDLRDLLSGLDEK